MYREIYGGRLFSPLIIYGDEEDLKCRTRAATRHAKSSRLEHNFIKVFGKEVF